MLNKRANERLCRVGRERDCSYTFDAAAKDGR
jgi:hypothetical protein